MRALPGSKLLCLALMLLAGGSVAAQGAGEAARAAGKAVLVLVSERSDLPSIPDFERGLREKLSPPGGTTELFVEYLDFGRFPEARHEAGFARHLRDRYSGRRIDVVVPFQEAAFEFLLAHRAELFPDVPVVAAGMERQHVEGRALPPDVTTIPVIYDYRRTLELAHALQPDAREVLVVHGVAEYDLRRREDARRSLESFVPRLTWRMLSGVPLPEIEDAVRNLPPHSFVLFLSMVRDAEGKSLVGQDYASRMVAASPVPIYGTFVSHMARGTLGGAITDFEAIGRATSTIVARTLSGNPPSAAIAMDLPETPLRVNWHALEKWHIAPERVPQNVQVVFREPSLWHEYRGFALTAIGAVLIQALLIMGLLLQSGRRRRAEAQLRESEERLRMATDATQVGIWSWTASGDHMWATESCRSLHGLPQEGDISFRMFLDQVHPDDRQRLREGVQEALRERRLFSVEYRVRPRDEIRWITTRGRGTYREHPEPLGVMGVSADMTDRKMAEETLRLAVEALPIAVVMVNRLGRILLANSQAETLLGYETGELAGRPVDLLVPDRLRSGHAGYRTGFFAAPEERAMAADRELFARRKDGSEIPVEIGLNPIRSGEEMLVLAAIVDLTARQELKRKQHELEHIGRVSTMGEIAGSLAHELSQPLAAILSNAQAGLRFLDAGNPDPQEIREILQDVVADDKRAGEVVGALRSMLRRGKTESAVIDVAAAARDVLALLHSELVGQQVEVETGLEPGCFVIANKTQIEQVLLNLVMNGIDAMRPQPLPGRHLRVEVSRAGAKTVRVAVRDSGVGIPAEDLDRVFEAFWTTKASGMGMGLAVCGSIVKSCGGVIRVEPNADRGVTFSFTVPLAAQPVSN